jgi:hypothetical protein
MKIIAFGHKKQVGKNLTAQLLFQNLCCDYPDMKIEVVGFADPLYHVAHYLYGWAGFKIKEYYDKFPQTKSVELPKLKMTPRELLIKLGTKAIRENVYDATWVDYIINKKRDCDLLLITDLRFPNEFNIVKNMNGLCIRIDRPSIPLTNDIADCALDGLYSWDHVILNDGTKRDLNFKIMEFWDEYKKSMQ